jgi:hypothetical protein
LTWPEARGEIEYKVEKAPVFPRGGVGIASTLHLWDSSAFLTISWVKAPLISPLTLRETLTASIGEQLEERKGRSFGKCHCGPCTPIPNSTVISKSGPWQVTQLRYRQKVAGSC